MNIFLGKQFECWNYTKRHATPARAAGFNVCVSTRACAYACVRVYKCVRVRAHACAVSVSVSVSVYSLYPPEYPLSTPQYPRLTP